MKNLKVLLLVIVAGLSFNCTPDEEQVPAHLVTKYGIRYTVDLVNGSPKIISEDWFDFTNIMTLRTIKEIDYVNNKNKDVISNTIKKNGTNVKFPYQIEGRVYVYVC